MGTLTLADFSVSSPSLPFIHASIFLVAPAAGFAVKSLRLPANSLRPSRLRPPYATPKEEIHRALFKQVKEAE